MATIPPERFLYLTEEKPSDRINSDNDSWSGNLLIDSIKYIIKINPKISIIVTRGSKPVIMILNKIIYKGIVPKINLRNENGAGDALAAIFFLSLKENIDPFKILSFSIASGCLKAMDYKYKSFPKYYKKLQLLQKSIKVRIIWIIKY